MHLAAYLDRFRRLNVNVTHGQASPHKICMLLAVLDLARAGALRQNRIDYAPPLLERYGLFFRAVQRQNDHPNPHFPFFHLTGPLKGKGDSFWHLQPKPGREDVLASLKTVRSARQLIETIDYAYLDPGLFECLQDAVAVEALSAELAQTWFGRGLEDLGAVVVKTKEISRYESVLRGMTEKAPLKAAESVPAAYVRDPAFRRVVTESYDFRCAATGLRLILPDGSIMVEAAHIHPFSEAGDDDPRNGLALTPDMHWALDRYLIAPDTDYRWRVSSALDRRIPDYQALTALEGQPLFLPREARMYPKRSAIEWRLAKLA
jgi:putative restriction endonuclease